MYSRCDSSRLIPQKSQNQWLKPTISRFQSKLHQLRRQNLMSRSPNFDFIPREVTPTCTTPPGTSFPDTQMVLKWQHGMRVILLNWSSTMILRVKDGCKTSMLGHALLVSCLNSNFNLCFFSTRAFVPAFLLPTYTHGMKWKIAWNHMVCLAYG